MPPHNRRPGAEDAGLGLTHAQVKILRDIAKDDGSAYRWSWFLPSANALERRGLVAHDGLYWTATPRGMAHLRAIGQLQAIAYAANNPTPPRPRFRIWTPA